MKPVPGGNIPSNQPYLDLKMVFSDGGAFDHQSIFEQIKERAAHAMEVAREAQGSNVDMANIHLEQLPAYEPIGASDREAHAILIPAQDGSADVRSPSPAAPPNEPPPGYEETQAQAVGVALDTRLRAEAEHSSVH